MAVTAGDALALAAGDASKAMTGDACKATAGVALAATPRDVCAAKAMGGWAATAGDAEKRRYFRHNQTHTRTAVDVGVSMPSTNRGPDIFVFLLKKGRLYSAIFQY